MAIKIIKTNHEKMVGSVNHVRAEIIVDSPADLTIDGFLNYHFTMGSIAYCISEDALYVLNSAGTWNKNGE